MNGEFTHLKSQAPVQECSVFVHSVFLTLIKIE